MPHGAPADQPELASARRGRGDLAPQGADRRTDRRTDRGQRVVLVAARSAVALHRLLDALPVFEGDPRVVTRFTLVPGSRFGTEALAALDRAGARTVPWEEARRGTHDLVLAASPKGELRTLSGPRALLPHGAGFNKSLREEGSAALPSGLDPHFLMSGDAPWADLYALAHDADADRLTRHCPSVGPRAAVVGDPTLDRLLVSVPHREAYRDALGTGPRRLVVLVSTWGPESLLERRPGLPGELLARHPHDTYRFALVLHPNAYSETGTFDLARHLAPALSAGLLLPDPYEEWAALLVAADAVVTDHGSTALYAAALGRPVVSAYDGDEELVPDSPMARLLASVPRLAGPDGLEEALRLAGSVDTRAAAGAAFAPRGRGRALERLRRELYRLLDLTPPAYAPRPRPFRCPAPPRTDLPETHAVRAEVTGDQVVLVRFPPETREPVHHLAAEYRTGGERAPQSAAVVWRRAYAGGDGDGARGAYGTRSGRGVQGAHGARGAYGARTAWTAGGWTAHALDEFPGCRTAAAILSADRCLLRHHRAGPLLVHVEPQRSAGRVARPDPVAVVSAVHAWLGATPEPRLPAVLSCAIGPVTVRVRVDAARPADLDAYEL
ncbi:translation initiation factor 2 [Streptomyces laurentii]|uniref:translation initiation factor 2 n=1 Tax=Streptomyces laurentii TaxID=39478 RepID=UPI0033FAF697